WPCTREKQTGPRIRPRPRHKRSASGSVALDNALTARAFQARAHFLGLLGGRKGADLGTIVHALVAKIGTPDHRLVAAEDGRIFLLQRLERRLGIGLAP